MNRFRVDLHIHTLLSPCGDLSMGPRNIVQYAARMGLDAIAVSDHNTLHQIEAVAVEGKKYGLFVFPAVEITTREEAHCVAFMPDLDAAAVCQKFIDDNITKVPNNPEKMGDQVWVDVDEMIVGEVEWYLNMPVNKSIDEIVAFVNSIGGMTVPAHVDRSSYSLIGQLGFIDPALPIAAVEFNFLDKFSTLCKVQGSMLSRWTAYTASDAHFPNLIGTNPSWLHAESRNFSELRMAFAGIDGRGIVSAQVEQ